MDTCYIFGVSGALLDAGAGERRKDVATEIGELILRALGSTDDGQAASAAGEMRAAEVRLLCDPDLDELATYVWSGGNMHELGAASDSDLRETLDSIEREVISRWKQNNPGYAFVIEAEG